MSGVDADADEDDDNEPMVMTDDNGVIDGQVQRSEYQDPKQRASG